MNVATVLSTYYGIESNKWVRLSPKISEIILLNQDAIIYVDENQLFYFDTTNELMSISRSYSYPNIEDANIESDYGSYKHHYVLNMNNIAGFVSTTIMGPYGSYFERVS